MGKNIILIISGTMASGKDAVLRTLKKDVDFSFIKSLTSRPPRANEKINRPYDFISPDKFKRLINRKFFWEFKKIYGYFYGISKKEIRQAFARPKPIIFRVDEQGATKIKKAWPQAVSIFIAPPSLKTVKQRAAKRKNVSPTLKDSRLAAAQKQLISLTKNPKWDYVVINKNLRKTVNKLKQVLSSLKSKQKGSD